VAEISPNRCVYVEAVPGIAAVRIGRTIDLLQRLRWFEYSYFPIEVVLVGECNAWESAPEEAEGELFSLLDGIHLWRHNRDLYTKLPTLDWYLPDRRKILEAFFRLCRGKRPLLTRVYRMPLFDRVTKTYPLADRAEARAAEPYWSNSSGSLPPPSYFVADWNSRE